MKRDAKEIARIRAMLADETYQQEGALRWISNDTVIGLDTFEDAKIAPPPRQAQAREAYVEKTIAAYKASQPSEPSDEERFEARAAHGPGVELVNVFTGRRFTT